MSPNFGAGLYVLTGHGIGVRIQLWAKDPRECEHLEQQGLGKEVLLKTISMRQETLAMIYAAAILAAIGMAVLVLLAVLIVCFTGFRKSAEPQQGVKKNSSKKKSATQLSESRTGEAEEPSRFPAEFDEFIRSTISTVSAQCTRAKKEFAILILLPDQELRDVCKNLELDSLSKLSSESDRAFPPEDQLTNYIAAVSQRPEHAEAIVLEKLDVLMEKFGEDRCKTIVLCSSLDGTHTDPGQESCKAAIIEKLGPLTKSKRVIVVCNLKGGEGELSDPSSVGKVNESTPEEGRNVVRDLTNAGMEVMQVPVDSD